MKSLEERLQTIERNQDKILFLLSYLILELKEPEEIPEKFRLTVKGISSSEFSNNHVKEMIEKIEVNKGRL